MKSIRTKYLLAFCIPIILLLMIYLLLGIYPFGAKTIASGDLLGQYVAINNYIRNNIIGISSLSELRNLLFSTSAGLGINFFPVLTYYAFSPLNLISLFFNRGTIPLFFELNIILDTGILGLTAYTFFVKSGFVHSNGSAIIGSTLFALSSYMLVYGQCLMWFNSIILFPWQELKKLPYSIVQYPWRLLGIAIVLLALYFSNVFTKYIHKNTAAMLIIFCISLALFAEVNYKVTQYNNSQLLSSQASAKSAWGYLLDNNGLKMVKSRKMLVSYSARYEDYLPTRAVSSNNDIFDHNVTVNGKLVHFTQQNLSSGYQTLIYRLPDISSKKSV